ncbi:hypothetical protein PJK45_03900 [Mycobacterium kansasii]|uniref:hypothetical protein n=1 Tax=Mycobacterium kansasii TaxID=1768 RepID=UPI0009B8D70B|nr:hypothetical protein [Mycobacterium kansasii]ARG56898.1 hypothetical protein B1T43_14605 [Mycobacterium kansasii]ARG62386.1 hypothetical protein B1T45_14965 [Mycobacterium kansasii]ARG70053.1 hypothetical protein B1T47_14435 [Mycobacterium kansasii]ARG75379.1 hypothetical protein B1T51_13900 [Mycobacterium kansasii]ARG80880.1 hypothetical protein B1T52_14185 [Mycobacterium kansasii]
MSREIAGKVFYTPEEAEQAGLVSPTPEEIARAQTLFDDFQKKVDSVPPNRAREVSPKFWDDTSGTEYERPGKS